MLFRSHRCCISALAVLLAPLASHAGSLHLVTVDFDGSLDGRELALQRAVLEAARGRCQVVPPRVSRARLTEDEALRRSRRAARALALQASALVEEMRYEQALPLLDRAEHAALRGLSRIVEPGLLSEIYLARGLALLPVNRRAAQGYLVLSSLHGPARAAASVDHAPKIREELRWAAVQAKQRATPEVTLAEATQVAHVLDASRVLLATVRQRHHQQEVVLLLYDALRNRWRGPRRIAMPLDADARRIIGALAEQMRVCGASSARISDRERSRWPVWSTLATGGAALVAGTVLAALAQERASEAESRAGQTPLVVYDPEVAEIEAAGRRLHTGAIALFAVGAAAGVTAAVLWLWPRGRSSDEARVGLAPGGIQLTARFH